MTQNQSVIGTTVKEHWEKVFATKKENEVSWYQPYPETSVTLLEYCHLPADANVIDAGGGNSRFIDALIQKGYKNIYLLDISSNAIGHTKERLRTDADRVNWVESDVTEYKPHVQFDLWHDRASFHFLTTEERIRKYVSIVEKAVRWNGYLVIGTFSDEGPKKCSGLDVKQYSESALTEIFKDKYKPVKILRDNHRTPSGSNQNFLFCCFQKK